MDIRVFVQEGLDGKRIRVGYGKSQLHYLVYFVLRLFHHDNYRYLGQILLVGKDFDHI